jgi:hypothetical protein
LVIDMSPAQDEASPTNGIDVMPGDENVHL